MKKHVALYNRVWEALHFDDKFVVCLDLTHDEVVERLRQTIKCRLEKHWLGTADALYVRLAEEIIRALMCNESAPPDRLYGKEDVSGDADETAA